MINQIVNIVAGFSVIASLLGGFVAIWHIMSVRKKFWNDYLERKKRND